MERRGRFCHQSLFRFTLLSSVNKIVAQSFVSQFWCSWHHSSLLARLALERVGHVSGLQLWRLASCKRFSTLFWPMVYIVRPLQVSNQFRCCNGRLPSILTCCCTHPRPGCYSAGWKRRHNHYMSIYRMPPWRRPTTSFRLKLNNVVP